MWGNGKRVERLSVEKEEGSGLHAAVLDARYITPVHAAQESREINDERATVGFGRWT